MTWEKNATNRMDWEKLNLKGATHCKVIEPPERGAPLVQVGERATELEPWGELGEKAGQGLQFWSRIKSAVDHHRDKFKNNVKKCNI